MRPFLDIRGENEITTPKENSNQERGRENQIFRKFSGSKAQ